MRRLLREIVRRRGYDLVPRGYYSVVCDVDETPDEVWTRRSPMRGIEFDTAAQLAWARAELAGAIAEWPQHRPADWVDSNDYYESVDAEILYAIVRTRRPARIVELGSGFSTRVIAAAARANADDGARPRYVAYDPYPRDVVDSGVEGLDELHKLKAQDVPEEAITQLAAGDVLFVDTSHTVKAGGDVNRIVLDLLPLVARGVIVHFHDILLPGEYHRGWVENGWYWAEAYLLQAFLCENPAWTVRWGSAGVWLDHEDELRALVPSLRDHRPTAFWIERVA